MVTRIRKSAKTHLYITEHMEALGLDDAKVAGRLGVAPVTVWRWRKEQWRLRPDKIAALAHALGLERAEDLYRLPGRPSIDAALRDAPDAIYQATLEFVRKIANTRS